MDVTLRLMNAQGFNVVERHEVPLAPLDVLGRDDVLERIGPLGSLLSATHPALESPSLQPSASVSGQMSEPMHVSIGSRLLGRLLQTWWGDLTLLTGAAPLFRANVRFLRLGFAEVTSASVQWPILAAYVARAQPRPNPLADRYLTNPDADAFVVASVLLSAQIQVMPLEVGEKPAAVDIPALQQRFGPTVAVADRKPWIDLRGPIAVPLAFRCYRLERTGGGWTLSGNDGGPRPWLIAPGTRVRVR